MKYAFHVSHMNRLVNDLAHQESLVAQWLERPTNIWEAMGSIPVGDSDFFFVTRSWQMNILSLSSLFQVMMGVVQTGTHEGKGRAGVMVPVPGYSMYQARLLQHNSYQVTRSYDDMRNIFH